MNRSSLMIAAAVFGGMALAPTMVLADPPCGRGWRKHEACRYYGYGVPTYVAPPPVVYARPPVYYAPPPAVVYAPPPVVYAPPPVVYGPAPGLSIGVNIPLR